MANSNGGSDSGKTAVQLRSEIEEQRRTMSPELRDRLDAVRRQVEKEAAAQVQKSFKRGGPVPKTGVYKLHKGERVLSASQARSQAKPRGRK